MMSLNVLVIETNRYAQQFKDDHPTNNAATSWKPVNWETMKAFLAMYGYGEVAYSPDVFEHSLDFFVQYCRHHVEE